MMKEISSASCAQCRVISTRNEGDAPGKINMPYNRTDQYPSFPGLEASAEKGCGFCGLIRHALQEKYSDEKIAEAESDFHPSIRDKWPLEWNHQVTVGRAAFSTEGDWAERDTSQKADHSSGCVYALSFQAWPYPPRCRVPNPESNRTYIWFAIYASIGFEAALQETTRRRKPDEETLSDANVSLITKWLATCSTLHSECRHKNGTKLPTRIIDLGPADSSQAPRLVVPSKKSAKYVALSHCWGSSMDSNTNTHARTVKANLMDMQSGIPLEKLPQNFQDAILTVQKLQLRFLWIDALCIIQDDPADWAREAARMNDVYGFAYLTIAATSATSSTDGFLRRPEEMVSSIPYYKDTGTEPASRLILAYQQIGDQGSWASNIETARWNTRGWTLQERLLSKRVLHFAERKMFWECRSTDASEENEPARSPRYRTAWLECSDLAERHRLTEQDAGTSEPCFGVWYSIVSRYSARELSRETDALPALSGLAQAFGAIFDIGSSTENNDYLLGIWRKDLAQGLLWIPYDGTRTARCSQYVAPTWSWASIKGQVRFPSRGLGTQITPTFVQISIERKPGDHSGAIVAAELTLLAKIQRLCDVISKAEDSWYPLDLRMQGKSIGHGAFDVINESENGITWIMECMFQKPWDFRDHPSVLLLRKIGSTPNTYERVGAGRMNEDSLELFSNCESQEICLI